MEETKKMKCYKRLIFKQFSKSQVLVAHSFWVICRKVRFYSPLWSFVWRRRIGVQFWYTNMAAGNQQKHLEFTFSTKALSFHLRASIRAHKHIFQYLKFKRRDFFQRDNIRILVSRTVETRKVKLLYFWNETCYGTGNLYKDLLFVYLNYLQPFVNKNSWNLAI